MYGQNGAPKKGNWLVDWDALFLFWVTPQVPPFVILDSPAAPHAEQRRDVFGSFMRRATKLG